MRQFLTVLTQYRHLLEFTHQAEQALLDYLKLVNSLPPDLSDANLQLIREDAAGKIALFTGFGIRDILETALEITAQGIITSVRQLDHLVRVRQTCTALQLGTRAALELSRLRSNSPREAWRIAAESALNSLAEQTAGAVQPAQGELGQSEASWIVVDTQRLVAKAGGKARCLLTVKNFLGQPLPGIAVTWETSLSQLDTPSSGSTDENGQVEINLLAGDEMGTAQVMARFGLDRRILAPLILIDCDDSTLYFTNPFCEPMQALAGNLEAIEYRLQVLDGKLNPGRDRVVQWSTDLGNFERPQTRTDGEGFASARLRSLSSGEARVVVDLPVNGAQGEFEPVTFLEQPYFQYVRFTGPVAATQIASALCRVVNLDGTAEPGVKVQWSADFGGFQSEPAESVSDADGIARIDYLSREPGEVILTVSASHEGQVLQALSSLRTPVHDLPRMVEREPEEQYFIVNQFHPASFRVRLEPPAAGYPVYWYLGEERLATTSTSPDGTAAFIYYFKQHQLGDQLVTVRSLRDDEQLDFKVKVVTAHTDLILEKGPDSPGMVPIDPAAGTFAFDPGASSKLLIRALRSDGTGDSDCRLTFTRSNGLDPATLGVVFSPAFGQAIDCDENGEAILQVDCSKAAFLPNSDPYSNEFVIEVKSNLGVTRDLRLRLRYLLDLAKSELHFFHKTGEYLDVAALSGRLQRRNGEVPLELREGARSLRGVVEGAYSDPEVALSSYEQGGLWLHIGGFMALAGELGSSCRLEAVGDLGKRIQFAGSAVYEPKHIISGGTLSITPVADPGLIENGTGLVADQGSTYRFDILVTDDDGPLTGVPLVPERLVINGAQYHFSGPTDGDGKITVELDTSKVVLGQPHDLAVELGHLSHYLNLQVCELVVTQAQMSLNSDKTAVNAVVSFTRREGRLFADLGEWQGRFSSDSGALAPWTAAHDRELVQSPSKQLSTSVPGTLHVRLNQPTSNHRYLLSDEFPITDDLIKGDQS